MVQTWIKYNTISDLAINSGTKLLGLNYKLIAVLRNKLSQVKF